MLRARLHVALTAVAIPLAFACREPSGPRDATSRPVSIPSFELVTTEIDRVVSEEEFALADIDKSNGICVKGTLSTNLLMKDANAATPSQPCPPSWQAVGTPKGIKVTATTYTEDKNENNVVCVKYVGDAGKTVVKDDNPSTPSQLCPPAFALIGKPPAGPKVTTDELVAADDDADGLVCLNAAVTGNFIVRDDNNATPSQPCPPSWYVVAAKGGGGDDPATPADPGKD